MDLYLFLLTLLFVSLFAALLLKMAARSTADKSPYPRIAAMRQPKDVKLESFSKRGGSKRQEIGFYKGHDYAQVSGLPAGKIALVDSYRDTYGKYKCPFCRDVDSMEFRDSYADIKFNANGTYANISQLDHHVLAYHYPYVR